MCRISRSRVTEADVGGNEEEPPGTSRSPWGKNLEHENILKVIIEKDAHLCGCIESLKCTVLNG